MATGYRLFVILLILTALSFGAQFFQQPEDLPLVDYDFIVIGGGNAGGVVASRLGEIPDYKVLVVEAGLSNDDVFDIQVPGFSHDIRFGTIVDWNFTTVPQTHLNDRILEYARARILGGCSSHNEMIYTRGSKDDYDRWARTTGDDNLSWDKILSYIFKTEKWSGPNDPNLSEKGHFDPSLHSRTGKLGVTAPYFNHPFNDLLFKATSELTDEFPFLKDLNDGKPIGLGWGQATIAHGHRTSSATAYLGNANNNVHVLLHSLVTRVLPVDETGIVPKTQSLDFRRVEIATSRGSPMTMLTAKREVVISGGTINTPQILLLSGIGPREDLEALGIKALIDNPGVGKNFHDQASITVNFSTSLPPTSVFNQTEALAQWNLNHTGPLAVAPHIPTFGWVRFPFDSKPFKDGLEDPTPGPNSPHIEFFFLPVNPVTTEGNATISVDIVNLNPISRKYLFGGEIKLATSSPFDQPIIDLALLAEPLDAAILLEGFRSAERLFTSEAFSKHILGLVGPTPSPNGSLSDDEFMQLLKTNAFHFAHGVGSCKMAPDGDPSGVVDTEFKVRDAKGLRVVDASVMPFIPSGHPQVAVYALAEIASDLIKRSY